MISLEEASERIASLVPTRPARQSPLDGAAGLNLGETVRATLDSPPFDHSGMDGYAVRAADTTDPDRWLPIVGEQPAGQDLELKIQKGEVLRIFTGAPIPEGADAVVMQEDTERSEDGASVRILDPAEKGEFIRRRGGDLCIGQVIGEQGTPLTPARLALLASQGTREISVHPPVEVALITTGDELRPLGEELNQGEIYNSNGPMLAACVARTGANATDLAHAPDDLVDTQNVFTKAMETAPFLVISGGVSVGDHDHVRDALEALGFEIDFWKVAIMPGKPFLAARHSESGHLAFGLPGNPVSSFVTFHLLVAPALRKAMGSAHPQPGTCLTETTSPLENRGNRRHFLRGRIDVEGKFQTAGLQQSHALAALAEANALLPVEPGETVPSGTVRQAYPI